MKIVPWHCPLSDFYEVMKKNSIFVPSIYIHEKLIRFYSKSVPSKVRGFFLINDSSIYFHEKLSKFFSDSFRGKVPYFLI